MFPVRSVVPALAVGAAASLLFFSPELHAHSGPARSVGVVVAQGDAAQLLVRTTYGMVRTRDAGVTFEWLCGDAVGFDANIELPPAVIFGDAAITIGTFKGPSLSLDGGCDWQALPGEVTDKFFRTITPDGGDNRAVAMSVNVLGGDTFEVELWSTDTNGQQWSRLGTPPPNDFFAFDVQVAPSDPNRIYLAGHDGPVWDQKQVVMRSDDRGQSWQRLEAPSEAIDTVTTLVGIDPQNADLFYVTSATHAQQSSFRVLRSSDGASFEELVSWPQESASVALSPDGTSIAMGNGSMGLWVASVAASQATVSFEAAATIAVSCLNWQPSGLYACADEALDGYTVGVSSDGGASFAPFMKVGSPCAPIECAETTSVGGTCPAQWEVEYLELGADNCSTYDGGQAANPTAPEPSGCAVVASVFANGPPSDGRSGWLLIAAALVLVLRRDRQR